MDLLKGVLILRISDKETFFDIRKYAVIIAKKTYHFLIIIIQFYLKKKMKYTNLKGVKMKVTFFI